MSPRFSLFFLPLAFLGCTARYVQDLPNAPHPGSDTRILDQRTDLPEIKIRAMAIDPTHVELHLHRISIEIQTLERTGRTIRREKVSEASWGPAVHLPVWTLGWAVLAPVWVYPAFRSDLERAGRWGLDLEEGRHDPEGSVFGPQVEVFVRETTLVVGPEILQEPTRKAPQAAAHLDIEARWASGGPSVSGRSDENGTLLLDLGELPENADPTTPIDVQVDLGERTIRLRTPVERRAPSHQPRDPDPNRTATADQRFLEWIESANLRLEEESPRLHDHLRSAHHQTIRQILTDWGQWSRNARRQMTGIDPALRSSWEDRLSRFESALQEAAKALDLRDSERAATAWDRAIATLH